jgi:hypothetical protein
MKLRESPNSAKVYLDAGHCLYDFDGTPYSRPDEVDGWKPVNTVSVPCLYDWQADPGRYGFAPHLVTHIGVYREGDEPVWFVAGGAVVYIRNWSADRKREGAVVSTMPVGLYTSRQVARSHPLVTVQW